jgi:hypothetical protein
MKEYGLGPNEEILTFEQGEMQPFRTRPYSFITSIYRTISRISMLAPNGSVMRMVKVNDRNMFLNKDFFSSQ